MMGAVELEPRPDAPTARAMDVFRAAFAAGVLVRTTGDTIALTPSLIISEAQIEQLAATIRRALRRVQ